MNPDERRLLEGLRRGAGDDPPLTPRDAAAEIGMHPKRCLALCRGFWGRRWLERSVRDDQSPVAARGDAFLDGRLTPAGMTADLDAP